mgnify:CR=1 FL=1
MKISCAKALHRIGMVLPVCGELYVHSTEFAYSIALNNPRKKAPLQKSGAFNKLY